MPLLVLALRGTKREQAGAVKRTRLPITPNTGAAAEDLEPRLVRPRPHNAVGCMLRGFFRVPKVRGDDHLRGR